MTQSSNIDRNTALNPNSLHLLPSATGYRTETLPSGQRVDVQPVGRVSVVDLINRKNADVGMDSRVPQEIAFKTGETQHRIFDNDARPLLYSLREQASRQGIPIVDHHTHGPNPESRPWVHVELDAGNQLRGIQVFDESEVGALRFVEGESPMEGMEPVEHLTVYHYENPRS